MAAICAVALTGWVTRPTLDMETSSPGPAALVADPAAEVWAPRADPETVYSTSGKLEPPPVLATEDVPVYYADECQLTAGATDPRPDCVYGDLESSDEIVLWGDSKMGQYFSAFDAIASAEGWRLTTYLKSACAPTVSGAPKSDCNVFGQNIINTMLAQQTPPSLVVISSGSRLDPELAAGMIDAAGTLDEAGIPVIVMMDNPHPRQEAYECATQHADDLRRCDFSPADDADDLLQAVADELNLPVVDMVPWLCAGTPQCPVAIGGQLIYRQGSHITDTYARSLTPFLHRELSHLGFANTPVEDISVDDVPARTEA